MDLDDKGEGGNLYFHRSHRYRHWQTACQVHRRGLLMILWHTTGSSEAGERTPGSFPGKVAVL